MENEKINNKVNDRYDASQIQILKGLEAVRRGQQCILVMWVSVVYTI